MKNITLFASILVMVVFSLSAMAGDNRLIDAIQHTQRAVTAVDGMDVAKHAEMAKNHANAAKTDKHNKYDDKQMDDGIKCLDDAIKEGMDGKLKLPRKPRMML